jgi:hypothetical protein
MGYYIDLEKITIDDYRTKLESAYLPPGRMILKEKTGERFGYFKSIGISNIKDLIRLLRKKEGFAALSRVDCFSGDYLTVLLRELNSIHPKPNKIADFRCISKDTVAKLEKVGIKDTEKLYGNVLTNTARQVLSDSTGISEKDMLKLAKLADLSRIKWVGVTFAHMLYDLGVDTVEKASKSDPVELHAAINRFNRENGIYKAQIGLNDIRICVNAAKELPLDIEY